jgi:hypothetical protein
VVRGFFILPVLFLVLKKGGGLVIKKTVCTLIFPFLLTGVCEYNVVSKFVGNGVLCEELWRAYP